MIKDRSNLVIVGAGDHGRVVLELLRAAGEQPIGFIEPGPVEDPGRQIADNLSVIGSLADPSPWLSDRDLRFVAALGDNRARKDAYDRCRSLGLTPVAAIHPTAVLLRGAEVEAGAMVCAGAIIGVTARVGQNAIINTAASVDHDNVIGPHATVAPGAHLAGRVRVGEGAYLGIGCAVREGCTVGEWSLVAGGAMVVRDIPPDARVAGVPAVPMT